MAERITPEVLVALAAGHIRPSVAKDLRARIAADAELGETYAGIAAMVKDAGPEAALELLDRSWDAHAERNLGIQRPAVEETTGEEPRKGLVLRLWPYATALAACLLIVLYVFLSPGKGDDADTYALALLETAPSIQTRGDGNVPPHLSAFDRKDYARALELTRAAQDTTPRGQMIMAYAFLRIVPPATDSARYYFGRVATGQSMFRNKALAYAGALAWRTGDKAEAERLLGLSADQEAVELLRRLKAK